MHTTQNKNTPKTNSSVQQKKEKNNNYNKWLNSLNICLISMLSCF